MNKLLLFTLPCFLCCYGCDYYDRRLAVVNDTNYTISIETFSDTIPDFPALNKPEYYLRVAILPKASEEQVIPGKNAWLHTIKRSKNQRLNVFVYTNDTVAKYHNMDLINTKRLYQRISLTQAELDATNWILKVRNK